ncbi:Na/Pi cotransporter family protein [Acinetobacter larvae]|uniref:Na/Pi cotransporter n=1 Tax=Acinetobacter larvae TaxID=1789224 RepID=A0A1B2M0Z8_9GAMM|nr:Na/Pi symporter [Acinetobacter larvae]AOA58831.1 Na/Pi cotransporter [Acinetobacter larvae]
MYQIIAQFCGGVGIFLIGMTLMTDSLKALAGGTLKSWLTRFTRTPLKAAGSGLGLTLIMHSSTATILATIGFVSAGVLNFSQAIGVVIGANIGTTSTGWLVALLGVKFSIGTIALPIIGLGAIMKLLLKGKAGLLGFALAGFGLMFYGIDLLQVAMAGVATQVDFSVFGYATLWAQLILVLIGVIMTVLLQSSTAAITTTLAALATGAIDLHQSLLLVIGQNVGAVSIILLSVVGASMNAKRTAVANVFFNLVCAVLAFVILLPLFLWWATVDTAWGHIDDVILVAAFHTAFSSFGALFFLPFIQQLQHVIVRLLPSHEPEILSYLDQASFSVPGLAISSAQHVIYAALGQIFELLHDALQNGHLPSQSQLQQLDDIIQQLETYLDKIPVSDNLNDRQRLIALLRIMVYVRVLRNDLEQINRVVLLRTMPFIHQVALDYMYILDSHYKVIQQFNSIEKMQSLQIELKNLKTWQSQHRDELRQKIMDYAGTHQLSAATSLELLAAQRWLERLIAHSQRLANVLDENANILKQEAIEPSTDVNTQDPVVPDMSQQP